MIRLPLITILGLVLLVKVVVPHNVPYRHRHVSPGAYGGSYGQRPSPHYGSSGVASLLGTPAKVVRVTVPSTQHQHHRRPYGGHIHQVGRRPQATFGVDNVPTSSFGTPGGHGVSGVSVPASGVVRVPGPTPGIIGSPAANTQGIGGLVGTSNAGITETGNPFGNAGISGTGNPFGGTGVSGGSIVDRVDVRTIPQGTGVPQGSRVGSCPPVRASCTTFRTSPPSCSTDDTCIQGQKCCFDTCVQRDICKSIV